jgi:hypothetical protein
LFAFLDDLVKFSEISLLSYSSNSIEFLLIHSFYSSCLSSKFEAFPTLYMC